MSRYPPSDYRGPRERSRSPPRFADRRASAASIFDNRPSAAPRNAADAPRGPRSQFDGPRASVSGPSGNGPGSRPGYSSLRDAPPLSSLASTDRGRPFRERDYERRDRVPSPRERSPARTFKDARDYPPRDFPPRDLDIGRARRASRDGPPSAGSSYSDNPQPFAPAPFRGGFGGRGRGRGDLEFRGGRGGRRGIDDREQFRRERSPPPPRWARDLSRDGRDGRDSRDAERRDDRRPFDRRDDDRRPDWHDREREADRPRRDAPPARLETRHSNDSLNNGAPQQAATPALQINPERLALLEQAGVDLSVRKPPLQPASATQRESRPNAPETPSYLDGRAEALANRYKQRGSSPAHAPAVPAFTLSYPPSSAPSANAAGTSATPRVQHDDSEVPDRVHDVSYEQNAGTQDKPKPESSHEAQPAFAAAPPSAPKAQMADAPPTAPRAPRALEADASSNFGSRLHGVRSLEAMRAPAQPDNSRTDTFPRTSANSQQPVSLAFTGPSQPTSVQPVSPRTQNSRVGELGLPTGPRASRTSPAQASMSPRPPFASPRSDTGAFQGQAGASRGQTPPPFAPSGPRNRSFSVSPKVASSSVPTAPKSIRAPPLAPRGAEQRGPGLPGRAPDRLGAPPPWAPPSAPRNLQWNQWVRNPRAPMYNDKTIPAKRDFAGEEKVRQPEGAMSRSMSHSGSPFGSSLNRNEGPARSLPDANSSAQLNTRDDMDIDVERRPSGTQAPKQPQASGHSAAQSFFGKPLEATDDEPGVSDAADEPMSSSEDDDLDSQEDLALLNAKYERRKRALESQMADLSAREYRATTPLESIARLSRISEKDLQRLQEHQEMDVDEPAAAANHRLVPPTNHSSGTDEGPDLLTPKGADEEAAVEVRSGDDSGSVRRARRPSPEVISLPYLVKNPASLHESDLFMEGAQDSEDSKAAVLEAMKQEARENGDMEDELEMNFRRSYAGWKVECEKFDLEKEEMERLEQEQNAEPVLEADVPAMPPVNVAMESRRVHKFSSEYEIERVLKESEETARLEQERQERESRKMQADMEKEADIPDQQNEETTRRSTFIDTNRLREPETLTIVFSYEPPPDTFDENEQQIFIAAFKETPKKWGEIASLLPGKTYRDCIHHYYANKWDGRFRDKTKKLKAGGRGRGRGKSAPRGRGSALMADLSRHEDLAAAPNVSDSGRPKRAAAPTTFGEREQESKTALSGPSPAKKTGASSKQDGNGEIGPEKPGKRRRNMAEKPGRKAKGQQPLAALAAAPTASPNKPFILGAHPNDDVPRLQSLEDASLLAGLHSGHQGMMHGEPQIMYAQDSYMQQMPTAEEMHRAKQVGQTPSSKSSASSYWSVPEQQDFKKYIAHFGTDFAAIAAHMGTKTQTMIKNHYQRQVDGGDKDSLRDAANRADKRRERGEDIGPPPTPTPIVKRKYDNNQPTPSTAPRTLAPQTDAMDIDEPVPPPRAAPPKHVSPPQYQAQPRFTTSAQATPIPAHRVVPSPVPSALSPAGSQIPMPVSTPGAAPGRSAPLRQTQHPLGQKFAIMSDSRPESRPGIQPTSGFRLSQDNLSRGGPQQSSTPMPDAHYMQGLLQEQERALKMQEQQSQQDSLDQQRVDPQRMAQLQRQNSFPRHSAQGSPANPPMQAPLERKPLIDERAPTPPRSGFAQTPFSRPAFGQAMFGPSALGAGPLSALAGRPPFDSPAKREEQRPASVAAIPQPLPVVSAPPAEPPKRSNLLSILNSEPEESTQVKRESIPSAQQRIASPAQAAFSSAPTPTQQSGLLPGKRETFGQPSVPQSSFRPSGFPPQSQTPAPPTPSHKPESSGVNNPSGQPPKPDWASGVLARHAPLRQQTPPILERDKRPYFSHRASVLGTLNQPMRGNPSPPPAQLMGHSRTPSLTSGPSQPPPRDVREQHPVIHAQQAQHAGHGHGQALHPNPYGQQPANSPFGQQPPPLPQQAHNHAHHAHNSSLSGAVGGFPSMHHRGHSREDALRQEQQQYMIQREREDRDALDWQRRRQEVFEYERQREADFQAHLQAQRQQSHERQAQALSRGHAPAPQPLHPPAFGGPGGFGQPRMSGYGARDQALRETEAAMQEERRVQEERRMQEGQRMQDAERRMMRQHEEAAVERRRHEEAFYGGMSRHTPLAGGYGHPPPPPQPPPSSRR